MKTITPLTATLRATPPGGSPRDDLAEGLARIGLSRRSEPRGLYAHEMSDGAAPRANVLIRSAPTAGAIPHRRELRYLW